MTATRQRGDAGRRRRPRVLLIDNYDSFTFNLVQRLGELGAETEVVRNDALTAAELVARQPERLVISPGPCTPVEAGISVEAIRLLCGLSGGGEAGGARQGGGRQAGARPSGVPILGVCLGHQSIGAAFGARVVRAKAPVHGKAEEVRHDGSALFRGAPRRLLAGRYHSLVVEEKSLPRALAVSARTRDGTVMALRHRTLPVFGVQFHPESILTPDGQTLLRNFLDFPASDERRIDRRPSRRQP